MNMKLSSSGKSMHATLTAPAKPNLKDYDLVGVNLKRIENAVIASCSYKLKPEAETKRQKGSECVDYDSRYPTEEHSFNTQTEAAEFVKGKILGGAEGGNEE